MGIEYGYGSFLEMSRTKLQLLVENHGEFSPTLPFSTVQIHPILFPTVNSLSLMTWQLLGWETSFFFLKYLNSYLLQINKEVSIIRDRTYVHIHSFLFPYHILSDVSSGCEERLHWRFPWRVANYVFCKGEFILIPDSRLSNMGECEERQIEKRLSQVLWHDTVINIILLLILGFWEKEKLNW